MARNKVWKLIDLPPQCKSIGNNWAFKIKCRADGSIDKLKSRLVVKGFIQIEGIDYEDIYMDQPIGFVSKGQEDKVSRLKISIYGLKQSFRLWCFRFHAVIISFGFAMVLEDHRVYVKRTTRRIMFLTLYVDDILLAETT